MYKKSSHRFLQEVGKRLHAAHRIQPGARSFVTLSVIRKDVSCIINIDITLDIIRLDINQRLKSLVQRRDKRSKLRDSGLKQSTVCDLPLFDIHPSR